MLISTYPHILICSYPHILISSASASQPASRPASQPASRAPLGAKCAFGAPKAPILPNLGSTVFFHTCPTFLDGFGAPECKSGAETRFECPNAFSSSKNIKKRRTRMTKCSLCDFGAKRAPTAPLERLGAFGPLGTPKNVGHVCKSAKVDFCNFIFMFSKNKKLQKVTFTFWHTCTTFLGVLRGQNRKVAF